MIRVGFASVAGVAILGMASPPLSTPTPEHDGKPRPLFSIAEPRPGQQLNGPLFKRVKAALDAASTGNGAGFRHFLASDADLNLETFVDHKLQHSAFTLEVIRAASASCRGPFSFDERPSWVQLSWVCRMDQSSPLSKFLTFRYSPELSLTVWLEKGLIKRIDAVEPLPIPGRRSVSMDAYESMRSSQ